MPKRLLPVVIRQKEVTSRKNSEGVELVSKPDSTVSTHDICPESEREASNKNISSVDDRTTSIEEQLCQKPRPALQLYQELCSKALLGDSALPETLNPRSVPK